MNKSREIIFYKDYFEDFFVKQREKVKEKLLEINSNYKFSWEDSYNPGPDKINKNHQLIAYIK